MGNRAVITTENDINNHGVGVYLHWNGGRDSVEGFLNYCEMKHYRPPEQDEYGWARLCQVIGNYFGGSTSIGVGLVDRLDTDNGDNGTYIVRDWKIVGRKYFKGREQKNHSLTDMLISIDEKQPLFEQIGTEAIIEGITK